MTPKKRTLPDVTLEMIDNRTFDDRIQLVEYRPRVLEHLMDAAML